MTREEVKELLPIMQAYSEGKTIEVLSMSITGAKWTEIYEPDFVLNPNKYRIKSEPKYRPFKSKEECWSEMMKHTPFGWVSSKNEEATAFVYFICTNYTRVNDGYSINGWCFNYEEMFDKYTFGDGTPFGINEG